MPASLLESTRQAAIEAVAELSRLKLLVFENTTLTIANYEAYLTGLSAASVSMKAYAEALKAAREGV